MYEWVDAPPVATSEIYIVSIDDIEESNAQLVKILNSFYNNASVSPLEYASVELVEKEGYFRFKVNSETDGTFKQGWQIPHGKMEFLVKVSKPGYTEVVGELEKGSVSGHGILAILVRDNN